MLPLFSYRYSISDKPLAQPIHGRFTPSKLRALWDHQRITPRFVGSDAFVSLGLKTSKTFHVHDFLTEKDIFYKLCIIFILAHPAFFMIYDIIYDLMNWCQHSTTNQKDSIRVDSEEIQSAEATEDVGKWYATMALCAKLEYRLQIHRIEGIEKDEWMK